MTTAHSEPDSTDWAAQDDARAMRSAGRLAHLGAELDALESHLLAVPLWLPAQALLAELTWVRGKIAELDAAWEHKLVVALVGPSGAGKSTLLNALAGRALSPVGLERPTTRQVVVYARSRTDAAELLTHVGAENVTLVETPEAEGLEHLLLVDTPDTNTLPENQRLLARLLERADVLLAVFPAQNPKLHDNLTFLKPTIRQLPPDAVWPVLNMVDRIPQQELEQVIVPDFQRALAAAWGIDAARIYLVSAKASAPEASYLQDEQPLHDVNEFPELRNALFRSLNQASQVTDRRLARAEHLLAMLRGDVAARLRETAPARREAAEGLATLYIEAREVLGEATRVEARHASGLDMHAGLYALLGARWWGPVGWLVTLWSLLVRGGSLLRHLGQQRNPLTALWGHRAESGAVAAPEAGPWGQALQRLYAAQWPPIADALVRAGHDPVVRQASYWQERVHASEEALRARWAEVYQEQLEHLARRLSSWLVQLVFNAPAIGMLGWVCTQTVYGFFTGSYLPDEYFRHAAIATGTVWASSFVVLQAIVSLAARGMVRGGTSRALADAAAGTLVSELQAQLAALDAIVEVAVERP